VVLAACGGSGGSDTATSSTTATTATAPDTTAPDTTAPDTTAPDTSTASTVTTDAAAQDPTDTGGATPPSRVGRVVSLGEEFVLADLLALGITPVASTATVASLGFQGMGDADTSGIEILPATELNLEQLAALDPDVIVTTAFIRDEAGGDLLASLGEVVVIPDDASPDEQLRQLAETFDRTDAADVVLAELDAAQDAARAAVARRTEPCTVSLATVYPGPSVAAWVDGSTDIPAAVLDTGCTLVPGDDAGSADRNGRLFLSPEQIGLLAAPTMILLQSSTVDGEDAAVDGIGSDALWQSLPAVADDAVIVLDRLGYPGVVGLVALADDLAELLGG
jgi:iron complex transport system substrate-binding protein